ncbi:hypothetical protein M378DRAFT_28628 [Amanita muscaria Koide BX008]|uniref:Uncharacterized protein n=1 Tax=Amanita muscaria (strain Koide BX008) TaxID=946122 RepID=A0A0C2WEJ0_AMAMK|nr:hypothetical protein M378DRAFT_28628 [Amanita muscaria Koide BX008]
MLLLNPSNRALTPSTLHTPTHAFPSTQSTTTGSSTKFSGLPVNGREDEYQEMNIVELLTLLNQSSICFLLCDRPKANSSVDDIPDLAGKVIIVTGGSTGIGREIVKALLSHNAKVYILTRNREKTEATIAELKELTSNEAHFVKCDLSDLKSIKVAADEFTSKEQELHVLINNAYILASNIGHFYLTKLLLPTLSSTSKNSGQKVRIVNMSSLGHMSHPLDFETFTDTPKRRKRSPWYLYCQSKFGNIVHAVELARRYGGEGVVSTSLHPGMIRSELGRHMTPVVQWFVDLIFFPTLLGALTPLYAATSPKAESLNGKYLVPWG